MKKFYYKNFNSGKIINHNNLDKKNIKNLYKKTKIFMNFQK